MARGQKETVYPSEVLMWATRLKSAADELRVLSDAMEERVGPLEVAEGYVGMRDSVDAVASFLGKLNRAYQDRNREREQASDPGASDAPDSGSVRPKTTAPKNGIGRKKKGGKPPQNDA